MDEDHTAEPIGWGSTDWGLVIDWGLSIVDFGFIGDWGLVVIADLQDCGFGISRPAAIHNLQ
jgi:hypothetical protein